MTGEMIMTRKDLVTGVFELKSEVKALQYLALLNGIPDSEIINFANYALKHKREFDSRDSYVARAVESFKASLALMAIREGKFSFKDRAEMVAFIKQNFRGKELVSGAKPFLPYVVIALDENATLVNKFRVTDYGKFIPLSSDDVTLVYDYLFANQQRIGDVKYISQSEYNKVAKEQNRLLGSTKKDEVVSAPNDKILAMTKRLTKKVRIV